MMFQRSVNFAELLEIGRGSSKRRSAHEMKTTSTTKRKLSQTQSELSKSQRKLDSCWTNPSNTRETAARCHVDNSVATCPICGTSLWRDNALNNLHIDKCLQKFEEASVNTARLELICSDPVVGNLKVTTVGELPGLYLIHNFISEAEEEDIMRVVESTEYMDWKFSSFNGNCYSKYFGVKTQFGLPDEIRLVRKNDAAHGEHDIPPGLYPYMERFRHCVALNAHIFSNEFRDFKPNECNMNSYRPAEGHYLRPHFDDRFLSGPILMNLSLCGNAKMTYAKPENASLSTNAIATGAFGHTVTVPLPRRCLQLVSGAARWSYTHEIRPADILDPRRVSITWRQSGGKRGILSKAAKEGEDVTSLLRKHASGAPSPPTSAVNAGSELLTKIEPKTERREALEGTDEEENGDLFRATERYKP